MTKMEKLQEAMFKTIDILNDLNIEFGPVDEVSINTRAKGRWGQCCYNRADKSYKININSALLEDGVSQKSLMNTLLHEYLHAHEDRFCHTGEWKRCAELVNKKYGFHIKRATTAEELGITNYVKAGFKYHAVCDKCGADSYFSRKSKVVKLLMVQPKDSYCHCGICGGRDFTLYT